MASPYGLEPAVNAAGSGALGRGRLLPTCVFGVLARTRDYQTMDDHRDEGEWEKEADLRAEYVEEWAELCEAGWAGPRHEPKQRWIYG